MLLRIKTILTNLYIIIYQYIKQLNNNSGFLANIINITVSGKLLNKKMIIKSEYMNGIASCLFVYFFAKFRAKKKKIFS